MVKTLILDYSFINSNYNKNGLDITHQVKCGLAGFFIFSQSLLTSLGKGHLLIIIFF